MGSSRGFGSTPCDACPLQARFHCGSGCHCLNRATEGNSPDHTPKGTPLSHLMVWLFDGMEAYGFRFCFTPLAGVLFTVPSRYCALSVVVCRSPWEVVPPDSDQISRVWPYSGAIAVLHLVRLRGFHALWRRVPNAFGYPRRGTVPAARPVVIVLQPHGRNGWPLGTAVVWAEPGSFATTTGLATFSSGYVRCFSSPGSPHRSGAAVAAGCPIRKSRDQRVLATPPRISLRCHVLHRHTTPGHPPYAHHVFFARSSFGVFSSDAGCKPPRSVSQRHQPLAGPGADGCVCTLGELCGW